MKKDNDQESRLEESTRFIQSKTNNLIKLQEIQQQIKSANRQRGQKEESKRGEPIEKVDGNEDAFEAYFENQMIQDMEGFDQYEQQIDYFQALKQMEQKIASRGPQPD